MTKISEIKVNLGNRSYPIYIGNDLFSSFEKLIEGFSNYSKLIIVTDNQVKKSINEKIFLLKKDVIKVYLLSVYLQVKILKVLSILSFCVKKF